MRVSALLTFAMLFFLCESVCAQEAAWYSGFEIKVVAGASIPVGRFGKEIAENSLIATPQGSFFDYQPNFFDKNKDGAASLGNYYVVTFGKELSGRFVLAAKLGTSYHGVRTRSTELYMDRMISEDVGFQVRSSITQRDYRLSWYTLALSYTLQISSLKVALSPEVGVSRMRFPSYVYSVDFQVNDPGGAMTYTNWASESPLKQAIFGLGADVEYGLGEHFMLTMNLQWMATNAKYHMELRSPGLEPRLRDDKVPYRTLNIGAGIGYKF